MRDLNPDWRYDYQGLVETMEVEVLLRVEDDDYQGDTRMVVSDSGRWGIMIFGWGSCSGCDALESCEGHVGELTRLRDHLYSQIHWEPSREALHSYIVNKDWELDYSYYDEEGRRFTSTAEALTRSYPSRKRVNHG